MLSDFGPEDSYVAEMKAVLLAGGSTLKVIDITHSIEAFDVGMGAFQLFRSYHYFPTGTIHLAVVDPGVGTNRKSIYVRTKRYHFVGPDNGLLAWAVHDCAKREKQAPKIYEIRAPEEIPTTFHGRDLFAPFVVGLLRSKRQRCIPLKRFEGVEFPMCRNLDGVQRGEIIGPDHFGNVITNIPHCKISKAELQILHRTEKIPFAPNYQSIQKGKVGVVRGSHGFWEIASPKQSAWDQLKVQRGDELTLYPLG